MLLAAGNFINTLSDLEPSIIFFVIVNIILCVALVVAIVLLIRHHRAQQRQVEALQTLLLRGIEPDELIKLKTTLERLSETDVEDLLASRGRPPETGSPTGSSPQGHISREAARALLECDATWRGGPSLRDRGSHHILYGCNAMVRSGPLRQTLFDENLPLYSYGED
jgi:hypothetical protein